MKKAHFCLALFLLTVFIACNSGETEKLNATISRMEIKLEATESQLLNVSAELSRCAALSRDSNLTKSEQKIY